MTNTAQQPPTDLAQIAAEVGLTVEQVNAIRAFATDAPEGVTVTAPLWSAAELADRRANGAAFRAAESEALLAAAMIRHGRDEQKEGV